MDATWTRNAFYRWLYKRDNIPDDIFDKMELVNIKEIKIPRAKIIVNITIHYSLKFKLSASNTKSGKAEEFLFKADTPVHQSWTKVFAQSINDNVAKFMNENGEKTEDVLKSILNERNFRTLEETFEYFKDDLQKYCKPDTIAYLREEAYKEFPALKEWSYESSSIDFINFVPRVEQTYLELGYVDYTL